MFLGRRRQFSTLDFFDTQMDPRLFNPVSEDDLCCVPHQNDRNPILEKERPVGLDTTRLVIKAINGQEKLPTSQSSGVNEIYGSSARKESSNTSLHLTRRSVHALQTKGLSKGIYSAAGN